VLSKIPFEVPAHLMARVRGLAPVSMAVAGADHLVALESVRQATDAGLIAPVLVGDTLTIQRLAAEMDWDVSGIRLEHSDDERGSVERAVALARGGEVTSLMKGQVHTDALMRAVVSRDTGLRTDRRLSHIFHMTVPGRDRVLYITDAAINVAPDADTQLHIVNNAVQLAHAMGTDDPKVAMLSATESVLAAMPSSVVAAEVVRRAGNGEVKGAVVDGPFAFDNAVSIEAAMVKGVDSPVAGTADILVVPNIEMGNGLFKMMVYFMSGLAAGVVMGAAVPIVLTSRADPPEARLAATAIAAIVAEK
jgi:phosphate acetyltransferase